MAGVKCLQCGGGGPLNWYDCVCEDTEPSSEAWQAVNEAAQNLSNKHKMYRMVAKLREAKAVRENATCPNQTKSTNCDASIVLICDIIDTDQCDTLSRWLFLRQLVSTPDGLCVMPTDADNAFHIRAVSVKGLGVDGNEQLWALFQSLPWKNDDAARLFVRMDGSIYQ
jgi:hypothetical protein